MELVFRNNKKRGGGVSFSLGRRRRVVLSEFLSYPQGSFTIVPQSRIQKINSYFRCKKLRNCTIWRERIFCIHSFAVCIHKYIEWISHTLYAFIHVQKVCMQQMNAFIYKLQNWSFLGFTAFKQANNSFLRLFRPQNGLSVNLLIFMLCKLTRVANSPDTRGKYNNRLAL